jgi:hypothetical protein
MIINAGLFAFDMHKLPIQDHIILTCFIIELLIIAFSAGAEIGRISDIFSNILRLYFCRNYQRNCNNCETHK